MTAEEFETGYCERSGITREQYREYYITMTCSCGCDGCDGFAKIRNTPEAIKDQLVLYGGNILIPLEEE